MALLRLLARDSDSLALLPSVVVQDELRSGRLVELAVVPDLYENFYAVSIQRRYESPLIRSLLARPESEVLEAPPDWYAPPRAAPIRPSSARRSPKGSAR